MTSIFDRWTDLDPALALRRIEAAHGSQVFDSYAYLDPQRALIQIETAFGIELDDVNGLLDPSTLEAAIDTAIEADSSPDWVPADAKIYIDLIAPGRAWTETDGEVAIDTLLGSDPLSGNAWDSTSYNSENLTADGYNGGTNAVGAIGDLKTFLKIGATTTIKWRQDASDIQTFPLTIVDLDGSHYLTVTATQTGELQFEGGQALEDTESGQVNHGATNAINQLACTLTDTRFEVALNGLTPFTTTLGIERPAEGFEFFLFAPFGPGNAVTAWQSITIYDALPSTAGLSALSETG